MNYPASLHMNHFKLLSVRDKCFYMHQIVHVIIPVSTVLVMFMIVVFLSYNYGVWEVTVIGMVVRGGTGGGRVEG